MKKQDYIDYYCSKVCTNSSCGGVQSICHTLKIIKKVFDAGYNQGRNDADAKPKKKAKRDSR